MSRVNCIGSESHLVNCSHTSSSSSLRYCSHYRDVGVECPGVYTWCMLRSLSAHIVFNDTLQFLEMSLALPMAMPVLSEVRIGTRVEWRSAIMGSGGQSVMTYGEQLMQGWPADSLVTQELVRFLLNTVAGGVGSIQALLILSRAMNVVLFVDKIFYEPALCCEITNLKVLHSLMKSLGRKE